MSKLCREICTGCDLKQYFWQVNTWQPARDFLAKAHKTLRFTQFVQCGEYKLVLPLNGFYTRKLV